MANLTDEERRIVGEADNVRVFLESPGGQRVLEILMQGLDQIMVGMGSENRTHQAEWYAGGVAALQGAIQRIYGQVSWAERVVRIAQKRREKEVVRDRGQRRPRTAQGASREAI